MRQAACVVMALVLVASVAAVPFEARPMMSDARERLDPDLEIVDTGTGDTAVVIVARKAAFEPFAATLLRPEPSRPRVIAYLIGGQSLEVNGGVDGLVVSVARSISTKGLCQACLVSCGDCAVAAATLTESLAQVSGLVLLNGTAAPAAIMTKAVYFTSGTVDSLFESIDEVLGIVELEPPESFVKRVGGFIPR